MLVPTSTPSRLVPWQERFVLLLPDIERNLKIAFSNLGAEAGAEAIDDAVVHCLIAYVQLLDQGRAHVATASTLSRYATLHVRGGRSAGCRMNSKEPLARYAQLKTGIKVVALHNCDPNASNWIADLVDTRHSSVADQVATRLDFRDWLSRLSRRMRSVAVDLARGFTTSEVARKYDVSSGRISQLRRELCGSWRAFQGEPVLVARS